MDGVRRERCTLNEKKYEKTFQEDEDILYHNGDKEKIVYLCQNSTKCLLKIDQFYTV